MMAVEWISDSFGFWDMNEDVRQLFINDILQDATKRYMEDPDLHKHVAYGYCREETFLKEAAKFLSHYYTNPVSHDNLLATFGATFGSHLAMMNFFEAGDFLFYEDITFAPFTSSALDYGLQLQSVNLDDDGLDTDDLESKLTSAKKLSNHRYSEKKPYWAMLYLVPIYHNPTGVCYNEDKFRSIISIARKHNILVLTDDVYNFFHYGEVGNISPPFPAPPRRMVSLDEPTDPEFGLGHVISNGTFSKIFAPAFRLGWVESSRWIINQLSTRYDIDGSGGCNNFVQGLFKKIFESPNIHKYMDDVRSLYARRYFVAANYLKENLNPSVIFNIAPGSLFLWLQLPKPYKAADLLKIFQNKYGEIFQPAESFTYDSKHDNCLRLSPTYLQDDKIKPGLEKFCKAVEELFAGDN